MKILIVEDNSINRKLAEVHASSMGLDFRSCASAHEAIDCVKEESFDFALVDLGLPGKNGDEFIRDIRKDGINFHCAMISSDYSILNKDGLSNVNYYDKPLTKTILKEIVDKNEG